jgi:hypothetical protein
MVAPPLLPCGQQKACTTPVLGYSLKHFARQRWDGALPRKVGDFLFDCYGDYLES